MTEDQPTARPAADDGTDSRVDGADPRADDADSPDQGPQRPLLRVVKGDPTPEELAALVAVVAASAAGGARLAPRPASDWAAPHRRVRVSLPHGPGGWRASALPR